MVAKPLGTANGMPERLNLAKIHMVAKLPPIVTPPDHSLNLAKIHMVAKLLSGGLMIVLSLNLAKIHMVAKHSDML